MENVYTNSLFSLGMENIFQYVSNWMVCAVETQQGKIEWRGKAVSEKTKDPGGRTLRFYFHQVSIKPKRT